MPAHWHDVRATATGWVCSCRDSGAGYPTAAETQAAADEHVIAAWEVDRALDIDPWRSAPPVGTAGRDEDCPL